MHQRSWTFVLAPKEHDVRIYKDVVEFYVLLDWVLKISARVTKQSRKPLVSSY
jgi:hypothetical protein